MTVVKFSQRDQRILNRSDVRVVINRFEEALFAGNAPQLEESVPADLPERLIIIEELAHIEIECRIKRGEAVSLDEYSRRSPELTDDSARRLRLQETIVHHSAEQIRGRSSVPEIRDFGDYQLLREVARGGMGVVYKARQTSLNRIVAIKMILTGKFASSEDVRRFHTETEVIAKLDHPGIVPIYEVGQIEGQHYFTMAYVEGESLAARLTSGPLPPREAAAIVRLVAEATHYAHENGVIHRDLKPANILLDRQGHPRVTDFGLAKLVENGAELTGSGQVIGTPCYMPPEQAAASGRDVDRRSDVYSLGAILYCLLTGRPPFQAATTIETLLQVQKQEPVPSRQFNANIPWDLDTIALKCLEKSPAKRYQTASELAEELMRFSGGIPILARRIGLVERYWRWCRREPIVSGLSLALVVFLISVTIGSLIAVESFRKVSETAKEAATTAKRIARESRRELARALISEARMLRRSQRVGQFSNAITKLKEASEIYLELQRLGEEILPSIWAEVRDEAIAALLVPDLTAVHRWKYGPAPQVCAADLVHKRYVCFDESSSMVHVRRFKDDRVILSLEGLEAIVFDQASFSRTGDHLWLHSPTDHRIHIWKLDGETATYLLSIPAGKNQHISSDGTIMAVKQSDPITFFYRTLDGKSFNQTSIGEPVVFGNPMHPHQPWMALRKGGKLQIFDYESSTTIWESTVPAEEIRSASWSSDGQWLTIATAPGRIVTFAAESGQLFHEPLRDNESSGVEPVSLAAGNIFAMRNWSDTLKLFDVRTGRHLLTDSISAVYPEDPLLTSGDTSLFFLRIDDHDFQVLKLHRGRMIEFAPKNSYAPVLSRSGRIVAASYWEEGRIRLFQLPSGESLGDLPLDNIAGSRAFASGPLAFEPNDRALLCYGKGVIRFPIEMSESNQGQMRFGPPSRIIDYHSGDKWGSSAECDVIVAPNYHAGATIYHRSQIGETKSTTIRTPPNYDVRFTAASPDGKWIMVGCHGVGTIAIHLANTGELVKEFPGKLGPGKFSPDNRWVLVDDLLVSVEDWKIQGKLPGRNQCAFTNDGRIVAVQDGMSSISLFETETLRKVATLEVQDHVHVIPHEFTPDGRGLIVSTIESRRLLYLDLAGLRSDLSSLGLDWDWPSFPANDDPIR